jgi:hypothetical protein
VWSPPGACNNYKKIFLVSSLLYTEEGSNQNIVQALIALGNISTISRTEMLPPSESVFDLTVNRDTLSEILAKIAKSDAKSLEKCQESGWTRRLGESIRVFENRQDWEWRSKSEDMMSKFVAALQTQIPYS